MRNVNSMITQYHDNLHNTANHLNTAARVIATIFQTIFILQMKQYRRCCDSDAIFSVRNIYLIMCIANFDIWFSYTFVPRHYELFGKHHTFEYTTWLKFKHFWVPFVIFYHFECFITFYQFFKK